MNASILLIMLLLLTSFPSSAQAHAGHSNEVPRREQGAHPQQRHAEVNAKPQESPTIDDKSTNPPAEGFNVDGSDSQAIAIADATMKAMGGREAWDATRHLTWNFFARRQHVWDRYTGDIRIEYEDRQEQDERTEQVIILMNLHSGQGRAWRDAKEVTHPEQLGEMLQAGRSAWINDSYWLLMPYKLKDSGVTLKYLGERKMEEGGDADVLQLTFENVGDTPQNKYDVYVAKDSGLVEQWSFYRDAADDEPAFTTPWKDWQRYGLIMLSGDRGELRGRPARITEIAVFDDVPGSVYTSSAQIELPETVDEE